MNLQKNDKSCIFLFDFLPLNDSLNSKNSVFFELNSCFFLLSAPNDMTILKMIHQTCCSLDSCISELTDFLTVELVPLFAIELFVELADKFGVDEVHKRVPNIAGIVVIDRQI